MWLRDRTPNIAELTQTKMDISKFNPVFEDFTSLLRKRLSHGIRPGEEIYGIYTPEGIHTTEDSIRYTFFAALLRGLHLEPHQIILERPFNNKEQVDTYFQWQDGAVAVEFKYHRLYQRGAGSKSGNESHLILNFAERKICRVNMLFESILSIH